MDADTAGAPTRFDGGIDVYHADAFDVLAGLPPASVDAVVTDPPYGLEFMGEDWDRPWAVTPAAPVGFAGRGDLALPVHRDSRNPVCRACGRQGRGARRCACPEPRWDRDPAEDMRAFGAWCQGWAAAALRVLRPGGHLVAFGGARTWHRLAVAVEDAGFELRGSIAWLHSQGLPKGLDVARAVSAAGGDGAAWQGWSTALKPAFEPVVLARRPLAATVAGTVLAHGTGALHVDAARVPMGDDDRQRFVRGAGDWHGHAARHGDGTTKVASVYGTYGAARSVPHDAGRWPPDVVLDEGAAAALEEQRPGASRYFPAFRYEPKARSAERPRDGGTSHPTVKPLALMRWLVRLVVPPGGVVLDPFAGSGTTAEACLLEGFGCIAVERQAAYLPLVEARLLRSGATRADAVRSDGAGAGGAAVP